MRPSQAHKDDILIDTNQWIQFIDVSGHQHEAVEIDPIIRKIDNFWELLETHCVAECCGIDAFDFRPHAILDAAQMLDVIDLRASLMDISDQVQAIDSNYLESNRLNNFFHKLVFQQLLAHVVKTLKEKS